LKGLKFKQGDFYFFVDIFYVLHIAALEDVKEELNEIEHINFKEVLHSNAKAEKVIFIGKSGKVLGLIVEDVLDVADIKGVSPFENSDFVLDFIKGVTKIDNVTYYEIDCKKLVGV
jgi:chemotaxis signal transduction protein